MAVSLNTLFPKRKKAEMHILTAKNVLSTIITTAFTNEVGKFQSKNPIKQGMLVTFGTDINHDKEDGYRYFDLLVYGPMNYVGVYIRRRWTVIDLNDLNFNDDGDATIRFGKDYESGETPWEMISYHDSGWREGVRRVLDDYGQDFSILRTGSDSWYKKADVGAFDLPDE